MCEWISLSENLNHNIPKSILYLSEPKCFETNRTYENLLFILIPDKHRYLSKNINTWIKSQMKRDYDRNNVYYNNEISIIVVSNNNKWIPANK